MFNIYGDISSYQSFASIVFYANTEDRITINNYSNQQIVYTFAYSGNPNSVYEINGSSKSRAFGTKDYPFYGTLKVKGDNVYVNTINGGATINGHIYVEGKNVEVVQDKQKHSRNVHINKY